MPASPPDPGTQFSEESTILLKAIAGLIESISRSAMEPADKAAALKHWQEIADKITSGLVKLSE
jgi:hypothetical protein